MGLVSEVAKPPLPGGEASAGLREDLEAGGAGRWWVAGSAPEPSPVPIPVPEEATPTDMLPGLGSCQVVLPRGWVQASTGQREVVPVR